MNECRVARENNLPAVRQFLDDLGLIHADLDASNPQRFVVLEHGSPPALAAVAGLETFAGCQDGLLRSVAVSPALRRQGVGGNLVGVIETWARESGMQKLWLLTTTAPGFFLGLHYGITARESAPAAVRQSAEFNRLCPSSAVCLSKTL